MSAGRLPEPPATPRGSRPRGSSSQPRQSAVSVETVFAAKAKAIAEKAVELAKDGDVSAMRLVLDRVAPAPRERPIEFQMPEIEKAEDLPAAVLGVMRAVAAGEMTPGEAVQVVGIMEHYRKQSETADLAARIAALEEAHAHKS